jgi:RND superfamily putative drug exporter
MTATPDLATTPPEDRDRRDENLPGRGLLQRLVLRHRRLVLTAAAAMAVLGAVLAGPAFARLSPGGFDDPGSESTRAAETIATRLGAQAPDVLAMYSDRNATVDEPSFESAVRAVEARVRARPQVRDVVGFYDGGDARFVSPDRHHTYLAVQLRAADDSRRRDGFDAIKSDLVARSVTTEIGGDVAVQAEGDAITARDVEHSELISFPVVLLLLVIIFRGAVAAALPLVTGGLAILGALGVTRLFETATAVSTFAINTISLLGLGMAIDYALIVISRYREELAVRQQAGQPLDRSTVQAAVSSTLRTAGRTVLVSGVTVSLSLASLLVFPETFLRSMAFGGMAAVLLAMLASVTALPAVLLMLGYRINALSFGKGHPGRRGDGECRADSNGGWARFARAVMRRPVIAVVGVVAALAALSLPLTRLHLSGFDERILPVDAQARLAQEHLVARFPGLSATPVEILATGGTEAELRAVTGELAAIVGVRGVDLVARRDDTALLVVSHRGSAGSEQARSVVDAIRSLPTPRGVQLSVTGTTAELTDQLDSLGARLPIMLAVMALVTLTLLFFAFGSILLPVKAILVDCLSVAASLGAIVWGFQQGHLQGLLGFTATGTLEPTTLVLVVAVLFGLATDYEVFLLSRVREEWDRCRDSTTAVTRGLQRTGGLITAAALLLGVVTAGFATGDIVISKLVGVGMVVGLAVDALLVRTILVPATMRLFGAAGWWLPRPLAAIYRRFGLHRLPQCVEPHASTALSTTSQRAVDPPRLHDK